MTPGSPQKRDLPVLYYLDHFLEFLSFIEDRYDHVLEPDHNAFIADFKSLGCDAQCLYVRMLNRQGRIFHHRKLIYPEIKNVGRQLLILREKRFACGVLPTDFEQWLQVMTRDSLLDLISAQCSSDSYRKSWAKNDLVTFAMSHLSFEHDSIAKAADRFVVQDRCDDVDYLLFLYFGRREQGLSRFTLRDLGVVRTGGFRKDFEPRFIDKPAARSNWFYSKQRQTLKQIHDDMLPSFASDVGIWPAAEDDQSALMRQQTIYELGERMEKLGCAEIAESVYHHAGGWPSSERLIRLSWAKGDQQSAQRMLEHCIDDPSCDDELLFARDFYQRKLNKKRTSEVTDLLRESTILKLDECYRDTPERGAVELFASQGAIAIHCENRLWKKLFGLTFWQQLYDAEKSAIYNDFEKRPGDLKTGQFYTRFANEIEKRLEQFESKRLIWKTLVENVTRHYGATNSIFLWRGDMLDEIKLLLDATNGTAIATMLRRMAKDYRNNHAGFPDLLVIENGQSRFVEIKAEGDQLRRNQLKQFLALQSAGIPVEINRVEWVVDPGQPYVVVDIETTGRRSNGHAITEIAAVKLQYGEIIDEWHSLIRPGRSIPANITQLTGITNAMVSDAPLFSEIADSFRQFCTGSVFVAHNVRFDYGFISDAYRALEQSFHLPKLCTVVEMRKWFPGKRSYSLKNLCSAFDIQLDSHHRALCDARAAAELLLMINQKRLTSQQPG